MNTAKAETIERFFRAFAANEIERALAETTEDCIIDRTNSRGPARGTARGPREIRVAADQFREPLDGMTWEPAEMRPVGREHYVVATDVAIRGRSTGIRISARGAWMARFEGELIAEGVLFQSYEEALLEARRRSLSAARLYFVCEAQPGGADPLPLLEAAIAGGVEVIQMREKAPRCTEELIALSHPFARAARDRGALFFLNDRPDLVEACDADGVHVGQDDEPVAAARAIAGAAALVGLSTHSTRQFDAAQTATGAARADQISAGPVWETPTKAGRPAAGLELIEHAARGGGDQVPWFAIGGIDSSNIGQVANAGARRAVVVRAIRDAPDPESAARELRAALLSPS